MLLYLIISLGLCHKFLFLNSFCFFLEISVKVCVPVLLSVDRFCKFFVLISGKMKLKALWDIELVDMYIP